MTETISKEQRELRTMIEEFDNAMLSTHSTDGAIHARPMALADLDAEGRLWFITSKTNAVASELTRDARSTVTLQNPRRYVSLSGEASLVEDDESLQILRKPRFEPWFDDKNDACLICFVPQRGEYWKQDAVDAVKMKMEQLRSYAGGEKPEKARIQHQQMP